MAAVIVTAVRNPEVPGARRRAQFDFTFSTSYPANGEPMTPSLFGMQVVDLVIPLGSPRASAQVIPVFDRANKSLRLYTTSTGAEVAGASDQSSNLITIEVVGL